MNPLEILETLDLSQFDCEFCDVRIEDVYSNIVTLKNNEYTNAIEETYIAGFIRVLKNGFWNYSSFDNLKDIRNTILALVENGKNFKGDISSKFTHKLNERKEIVYNFKNNNVKNIPLEEKMKILESVNTIYSDKDIIKDKTLYYKDFYNIYYYKSSKNVFTSYDKNLCGINVVYTLKENNEVFTAGYGDSFREFNDLNKISKACKIDLEKSIYYIKNAIPVNHGEKTVVLSPLAAGVFAHESFGHKSEADFMIGDENAKNEWKIGMPVGSDILSIVDDGSIYSPGYTPFDDEGIKAKKTYLIKNGKLAGRLHSLNTANELDEEPTSNARAMNFQFEPIVRMTTTYIEPGNQSFDELISTIKDGILIDTVKHGSGLSTFTIAPARAYKITDGKVSTPLKISVISGTVFGTLNEIDGLSNNLELCNTLSGGCGKNNQWPLPVSLGGPFVRVRKMMVN